MLEKIFLKFWPNFFFRKKVILAALWRHKVVILAHFRNFEGTNYGFRKLSHHVKHSKELENIAYLIGNLMGYIIEALEIL